MYKPHVESHYGAFIVGRDLVQCDYDFPAAAMRCGWSLTRVQKRNGKLVHLARRTSVGCQHRSTDGTVDCRECGVSASAFIEAAGDYLASSLV
jgi:hypothetical protein